MKSVNYEKDKPCFRVLYISEWDQVTSPEINSLSSYAHLYTSALCLIIMLVLLLFCVVLLYSFGLFGFSDQFVL